MPEEISPQQQQPQQPPEVRDRSERPAGILPKNTQAIVIAGIALVMVGAIAFSGGSAKPKAKPSPTVPAVVDPSQARINEYRQHLDEQARKLAAEQAQLGQDRQTLSPNSSAANPNMSGMPYPPSSYASQPTQQDSIENDRKRREYASLYASNIALTYRKDALQNTGTSAQQSVSEAANPLSALMPQNLFAPPANSISPVAAAVPQPPSQLPSTDIQMERQTQEITKKRVEQRDAEIDKAQGKNYRVFEGTVLESVLTNRLNGSFSGPVNCMLTTNLYSHDGQHLLIPQGTRVLGEVKRVSNLGQERLAVVFHRLIMPDGYSVSLDQFQGLNQIGETGLRDQVNHHYLQVFGVSIAIGAIAGIAQADTQQGIYQSSADAYRQGFSESLSQTSLRILDRYLNVLPTVTIREGHRVKIYLADDLLVPAYDNHRVPGDL